MDLLGEWSRAAVDSMQLTGSGVANLNDLLDLAPTGWVTVLEGTPANFKREFVHETLLTALVSVAGQMGHRFCRRPVLVNERNLTYSVSPDTSVALTCVMNLDALEAEDNDALATIVNLTEAHTSYDLLNRATVYGAGSGENRLTLAAATVWPDDTTAIGSVYTAASGDQYEYDAATNRIENTTRSALYGVRSKALSFADVRLLQNTDAGLEAAANLLVKAAVAHLERKRVPQVSYRMKLADLRTRLYPGDRIHIDARRYVDGERIIDIDEDVFVLSVSDVLDANGLWTADVEASNIAAWPEDSVTQMAHSAQVAPTQQAHVQLTGNVDTVNFRELLSRAGSHTHVGIFRQRSRAD